MATLGDILTQLGRANGIDPKAMGDIWVKEASNLIALKNCRGPHSFGLIGEARDGLGWRCKLCGGEITGEQMYWYRMGLEHGRKETP